MLLEVAQPLPCKAAQEEAGSGPNTSRVIKNAFGFVSDLFCTRIKDSSVAIAE